MRLLVLFSLLPPIVVVVLINYHIAPVHALLDIFICVATLNGTLFIWGLILKIRAKKYWYRNYHIGKTMMLAIIPILACGYVLITEKPVNKIVTQQTQSVQLSIN
ncbi:hypothetical protein [Photobacterium nomapromontoriensis]|uniref:hypothetical protein n=1 Tax=Photobacterium nomapromontoriensis TaxID=2910237 RepID=UPI003D12718C